MSGPTGPDDVGATAAVLAAAQSREVAIIAVDRNLAATAVTAWNQLDLTHLQETFVQNFLPEVLPELVKAQSTVASIAAEAATADDIRSVSIKPEAFAGHASSGGYLTKELIKPLVSLYVDLGDGLPPDVALERGWNSMERILTGEVHDAARAAEQVQMVVHEVTYYIRHVEPGACGRCIILAGKHYKVNAGFERHVNCRCFHVKGVAIYHDKVGGFNGSGEPVETHTPPPYAVLPRQSPQQVFNSMTEQQQNDSFGVANAKAIRAGADIYRVVNVTGSKAGLSTTITDQYGNTRKGSIQGMPKGKSRLVPEAIFKIAGDDMAFARKLLADNGYIR